MLANIRLLTVVSVLFCGGLYSPFSLADLVFSVSPGEGRDADRNKVEQMYAPLVRYMERILDDKIVFDYPQDWKEYSRNMRNGRYDIVFDAPHFSSWRIKNINHTPVARLPGQLGHVIVTNLFDASPRKLRDLVGVSICSAVSPSLSNMTVYSMFDNPVHMPQIREIEGNYLDLYASLRAGVCDAAILTDSDYKQLRPSLRHSLRVVVRSEPVPERTITVSDRLAQKKALLAQMLTSNEGAQAAQSVFRQFGKKEQTFVKVKLAEYRDLDDMLSSVVYGW